MEETTSCDTGPEGRAADSRGPCQAHPAEARDPFRPRWMDIADPEERQCAHIVDTLGFCGHYIHAYGGGRSGRAPIICALHKHGGSMPQRELMGMFELRAGSLSEVLAKLERMGLIERRRDPNDRRQLIVSITESGREVAAYEQARRERFRADAFTCLSPEERDLFEDMLERVKQRWNEIESDTRDGEER